MESDLHIHTSDNETWQPPFVDVFKIAGFGPNNKTLNNVHNNHNSSKKGPRAKLVGNVQRIMDKTIGKSVVSITGAVGACNYVEISNLSLQGRFLYVQMKWLKPKLFNFVVELKVGRNNRSQSPVRISCSNMYKCDSKRKGGNVIQISLKDLATEKWHTVKLDIHAALELPSLDGSHGGNRCSKVTLTPAGKVRENRYEQKLRWKISGIRFCSNILVKSAFTSDNSYFCPYFENDNKEKIEMPKSISFPFPPFYPPESTQRKTQRENDIKDLRWTDAYGWKCVPKSKPRKARTEQLQLSAVAKKNPRLTTMKTKTDTEELHKENKCANNIGTNAKQDSQETTLKIKQAGRTNQLPDSQNMKTDLDVGKVKASSCLNHSVSLSVPVPAKATPSVCATDPLMKIDTVIGYSPGSISLPDIQKNSTMDKKRSWTSKGHVMKNMNLLKWSSDGKRVVYACSNNIIVSAIKDKTLMKEKYILTGHTSPVSCLALASQGIHGSRGNDLIVSGEEGKNPVIRIWDIHSGKCLSLLAGPRGGGLSSICFSSDCTLVCAVGKDEHMRLQIVVWDISNIFSTNRKNDKVKFIAKQTSEFDISTICFSPHDFRQLVSCGRENIRFWRIKNGHLVGRPVILNEYARCNTFTDIAIEEGLTSVSDGKRVFASSMSGTVVVVRYDTQSVECVYRLHDAAITCLSITEGFCVTGSVDNFLRVWPLDFSDFFLESKHEGGVYCLDISPSGLLILAGCGNGSIGVVDVTSHSHSTLMRTHVSDINLIAFRNDWEGKAAEMATASSDYTIRIWDVSCAVQMYEFCSEGDKCTSLFYHPDANTHVLVAGFDSGSTRVFEVASVSTLFQFKQHASTVNSICITSDCRYMFSLGSESDLCMYDVTRDYMPVRKFLQHNLARDSSTNFTFPLQNRLHSEPQSRLCTSMPSDQELDLASKRLYGHNGMMQISSDGHLLVFNSLQDNSILCKDIERMQLVWTLNAPNKGGFDLISFSNQMETSEKILDDNKVERVHTYEVIATSFIHSRIYKYHILRSGLLDGVLNRENVEWQCSLVKDWDTFHTDRVSAMSISPCNNYMATSGTLDHLIKVWRYGRKGNLLQTFVGHCARINALEFSSDGKYLVSAANHGVIILWKFSGEKFACTNTITSPRLLKSQQVSTPLHPPSSEPIRRELQHAEGCVNDNVKKAQLSLCHYKRPEQIVDYTVASSDQYGRGVVAWHPSSGLFVYAVGNVLVQEDLATETRQKYCKNNSEISCLALNDKGNIIATGSGYCPPGDARANIVLWRKDENSACISFTGTALLGHEHGIQSLAFNKESSKLVSIGTADDSKIYVWSVIKNTLTNTAKLSAVLNQVLWLKDEIITVGNHGYLSLWKADDETLSLREQKVILELGESQSENVPTFTCAALAPKWLAEGYSADAILCIGTTDGSVHVVSIPDGRILSHMNSCTGEVTCIAWCEQKIIVGTSKKLVAFPYPNENTDPLCFVDLPIVSMGWENEGDEGIFTTLRQPSNSNTDVYFMNIRKNQFMKI